MDAEINDRDFCANKHGGNAESAAAFEAKKHSKEIQYLRILESLLDNPDGLIEEEISHTTGMLRNSCSARIAELKAMGAIIKKPLRKSEKVSWGLLLLARVVPANCRELFLRRNRFPLAIPRRETIPMPPTKPELKQTLSFAKSAGKYTIRSNRRSFKNEPR